MVVNFKALDISWNMHKLIYTLTLIIIIIIINSSFLILGVLAPHAPPSFHSFRYGNNSPSQHDLYEKKKSYIILLIVWLIYLYQVKKWYMNGLEFHFGILGIAYIQEEHRLGEKDIIF
jgi:hypothetical protein